MQKKVDMKSDWSDSDDDNDSQVRGKPIIHDVSSDWAMDTDQQTTIPAPLRRPNTWPKVLICGRGRGKFLLANWTNEAKGYRTNDGHDISDAPPSLNNQNIERNPSVMAHINRQQTHPSVPSPCKSRKELANWTWVRLGNPRAKINNTDIVEQRHWQRHNGNNDNRTLDGPGDAAKSESVEGDQMHSEASKERPGRSLEDLE